VNKLEILTKESASEEADGLFDAMQQQMGMVPNIYGVAAHSPNTLGAMLGYSKQIKQGELTAKEGEAVALAIAEENSCGYCQAAHTAMGKMAGFSEEETLALRAGTHSDPKLRALTQLAKAIVATRGHPDKSVVDAFYAAGYGKGALVALLGHVALHTFNNYLDHISGVELDFPAAKKLDA